MKERKKELIIIGAIIIIQTIVFIIAGMNKSYIHMDEAYSLGLASYDKVEIQDNDDFYNVWHTKDYYEDYLTVNDDEVGNYSQVYENQKNDVHPPLYYLILRFAMGFHLNSYTKWTGISVNILIYALVTIFMYLIIEKILRGKNNAKYKALFLALISSLTLSSLTNVLYIRMYALSTLNIVITTYLHLRLLDSKQCNYKLLLCIGTLALVGSLTHYYYLFYLAMLFIMFVIKYIKEKRYKELISYVLTMCIAGVTSLIIFPYSIQHMFFGYRGQGAISKLINISEFISSITQYINRINLYAFNNLLYIILIAIIVIIIYKRIKKIKLIENKNQYIKYICLPTVLYFILVAISSPWIELRYILPVCELIFILVMFAIEKLLENIMKEEIVNKIMLGICLMLFIMPILSNQVIKATPMKNLRLEPEVMYSDKKEIVEKLQNEFNLPTIFVFNSNYNRFLDDILLFSVIDESYIAKNIEYDETIIKDIFNDKDITRGVVVFINEGNVNDDVLEVIKNATELNNITWLKRLNACDVYLVN